jgi:hypothetical protein
MNVFEVHTQTKKNTKMGEQHHDVSYQLKEYRMSNNKSSMKRKYGRDKHGHKAFHCNLCRMVDTSFSRHYKRVVNSRELQKDLVRLQHGNYCIEL